MVDCIQRDYSPAIENVYVIVYNIVRQNYKKKIWKISKRW